MEIFLWPLLTIMHTYVHTKREFCLIFVTILTGIFICIDEETKSQSQDSNPSYLIPLTNSSVISRSLLVEGGAGDCCHLDCLFPFPPVVFSPPES